MRLLIRDVRQPSFLFGVAAQLPFWLVALGLIVPLYQLFTGEGIPAWLVPNGLGGWLGWFALANEAIILAVMVILFYEVAKHRTIQWRKSLPALINATLAGLAYGIKFGECDMMIAWLLGAFLVLGLTWESHR